MAGCPRPFVRSALVQPPSPLGPGPFYNLGGTWVSFLNTCDIAFGVDRLCDWSTYFGEGLTFYLDGNPVSAAYAFHSEELPFFAIYTVTDVAVKPTTCTLLYLSPPGDILGPLGVPLPSGTLTGPVGQV